MGDVGMQAAANEVKEDKKRNDVFLVACSRGLALDAEKLISMGVKVAWQDRSGMTAMHFAAAGGHLDICRLLASKGAEVECEGKDGRTPLHLAAGRDQTAAVEWLLEKGAWTEAYDSRDNTALHCAAEHGSPATVKALLGSGANPSAINRQSLTPFATALLRGRMEVAKALEAGGALLTERPRGYPLLHLVAAVGGSTVALRYLLEKGANPNDLSSSGGGLSALHCAAAAGNLKEAQILLEQGANASLMSMDKALPHALVPAAVPGKSEVELETLRAELKKAAGNKATMPDSAPRQDFAPTPKKAATTFAALSYAEKCSKVKAWADWSEERLRAAKELNPEIIRRVKEVRRMRDVVELHTYVLQLHCDSEFQMDAKLPRVVQAIEAVRTEPSRLSEYQDDKVIMGVLEKLRRFQGILRSQGNTKPIGMQELVINQAEDMAETKKRHRSLEGAFEQAVKAAVAAACCVTAEQSREAAEAPASVGASGTSQNVSKAASQARDDGGSKEAAKSLEEAELDALFPEEEPMKWRDVFMYGLRIILAGIVSLVLAKMMAASLEPQLEEALRKAQMMAEEQQQSQSGASPSTGDESPFGHPEL